MARSTGEEKKAHSLIGKEETDHKENDDV